MWSVLWTYTTERYVRCSSALGDVIPCISTEVREVRQLLDENLLIPVGNREKIAELLKRLFIDKNLREELVKNSLELVKRFDWKNVAKIIKNVYLNVKNEKAYTCAF